MADQIAIGYQKKKYTLFAFSGDVSERSLSVRSVLLMMVKSRLIIMQWKVYTRDLFRRD